MMASLQRPNHGDISNGEKKGHFYWCLTAGLALTSVFGRQRTFEMRPAVIFFQSQRGGDAMEHRLIVHGRYTGRTFIPDEPLPDAEGPAQLVITPTLPRSGGSVADAFGTASVLRSGDDILAQVRADRDNWGDR
jgi:hypothetical protein